MRTLAIAIGLALATTATVAARTEEPAPEFPSTAANERFELSATTPKDTWFTDEPIEVEAILTYNGGEPATISSFGPDIIAFEILQTDGPVDTGTSRDAICGQHAFEPGDVERYAYQKSGSWDPQGELGDFWRAWFKEPDLRLPVGTYQIIAHAAEGPACESIEPLAAGVTISVVEDLEAKWGPLAVVSPIGTDLGAGVLGIDEACVTFTPDASEEAVSLAWPDGATRWNAKKGRIVYRTAGAKTWRLDDGNRVSLTAIPLRPGEAESWGSESLVREPDTTCPEELWLVTAVTDRDRTR